MIYTCNRTEVIVNAIVKSSLELDPADYLYCNDEEELVSNIEQDLIDYTCYGDVDVYDCGDSELRIPEEFIEEWTKLKEENGTNKE